jgi:transcriptional regulator with XRE-family HTH domain
MAIEQATLGQRLRQARESAGMTQDQVSEKMEMARATIAQIELGNRSVTGIELGSFAYLYGRDVREFLAAEFSEDDLVRVLLRADDKDGDDARRALRDCIRLGRELSELEKILGISRSLNSLAAYPVTKLASKWEAIQSGTHVAQEERRRLGLGAGPVGDIAALLESQGVRTGIISMPSGVSGLMMSHENVGFFVVVNKDHTGARQRFSWCHEYAHLLLDRKLSAHVSREDDRTNLLEVRANVFAACFLMPEDGVRHFVEGLGKGGSARIHADIFDEVGVVPVDSRSAAGSQQLQLYDVVRVAHHFGASVLSALYRLRNLRLVNEPEFQDLKRQDEEGASQRVAVMLGLAEIQPTGQAAEFCRRSLVLALEAFRQDKISIRKLTELAARVEVPEDVLTEVLDKLGLAPDEPSDVLLPATS